MYDIKLIKESNSNKNYEHSLPNKVSEKDRERKVEVFRIKSDFGK